MAGGGVALLYASKELEKLQTANFDQKIGVQIIQNALKVSKFLALSITNSIRSRNDTNQLSYIVNGLQFA